MASVQASKGSSDRTTPDQMTSLPLKHPAPAPALQGSQAANQSSELQVQVPITVSGDTPEYLRQALANSGYTYVVGDGAQVSISFDELRPQINIPPAPYGGPHKVVPVQTEQLESDRPMTDAEKLKADKEQLKLNLQNFRKTQKKAIQLQKAKQAAAQWAQKPLQGSSSTYQAFDLQNYKSPEDCLIGLQSAKKMLQQSAMFPGNVAQAPLPAPQMSAQQQQPAQLNQNNIANGKHKVTFQRQSPHVVHHPPPPSARRKRFHDYKESEQVRNQVKRVGLHDLQNNPFGSRRQARFVPLAASSNQVAETQISQNVHPNLAMNGQSVSMKAPQRPIQKQAHQQAAQQIMNKACQDSGESSSEQQKQIQQQSLSQLSQQLDKIATCLNYDQGEICQLFQQKYEELMHKSAANDQKQSQQSAHGTLVEPNLGLLLQLVQQDLLQKQKQLDVASQVQQQLKSHQQSDQASNNSRNVATQQNQKVSTNPSQTSEQQSVSSTVAVINHEDDEVGVSDDDGHQALMSDDSPVSREEDGDDLRYDTQEHVERRSDEDEEVDYDEQDQFMGQQSFGCYGGDQTEAYEEQPSHQNYTSQQQNQHQYLQHHDGNHDFCQSDYVEAVEDFTAEDEEDASNGCVAPTQGEAQHTGAEEATTCYFAEGEHDEEIDEETRVYGQESKSQRKAIQDQSEAEYAGQAAQNLDEEDDLDEDEFIEEEHQFTLNELYAQAHKQLLANGLGSKEDIRAWQALYPRLIGGNLTQQNLEQMINLGQANLTPAQAQEIFNFQQKQISDGLAAGLKQHKEQQETITIDADGNTVVEYPDDNQYEWCSQDSDQESNYDQEDEGNSQQKGNQKGDSNGAITQDDIDASQELQNFIYGTLQPPSYLSPSFKRFFSEFENNIDFILRFEYEILPQQMSAHVCKADQKRLKNKYENLLVASRDMCRRFTGPHSVLQIFLEKIVASINLIAENLKEKTLKEMCLWVEEQIPITEQQFNQLRKQPTASSSTLLIGHKKTTTSTNPELLITKTSKIQETEESSETEQQKTMRQTSQLEQEQQQIYQIELKPKPLLDCINNYTVFLVQLREQYLSIMKNCAPKISKHFTKLTAVIVENTQYEFPSTEIHKAVISKLILNDQKFFRQLVLHIKQEFVQQETMIRQKYPLFVKGLELFMSQVEDDMSANQTKIDIYMRDLRKHALDEYEDLYRDEQELIKQGRNAEGKKKRKKRKRKNKNAAASPDEETEVKEAQDTMLSADVQVGTQSEAEKTGEPTQEMEQSVNAAQADEIAQTSEDEREETNQEQAEGKPKKKKLSRRQKKKQKQLDKMTNELLNNLDTDDLVDFINNCGSKKEDLKKTSASSVSQPNIEGDQAKNFDGQEMTTEEAQKQATCDTDAGLTGQAAKSVSQVTGNKAIDVPSTQGMKGLSRKQRKELRAAQLAAAREEKQLANASTNQAEQTTNPCDVHAQDLCGKNDSKRPAAINETMSDLDREFEEQLEALKSKLPFQPVLREKGKMRPNVDSEWIQSVRQRLEHLELLSEKRSQTTSAN